MSAPPVLNPFAVPTWTGREELWHREFGKRIAEGFKVLEEFSRGLRDLENKISDEKYANDMPSIAFRMHGLLHELYCKTLVGIQMFLTTFSPFLLDGRRSMSERFVLKHKAASKALREVMETVAEARELVAQKMIRTPEKAVGSADTRVVYELKLYMESTIASMKHVELVVLQIGNVVLPELQIWFVEG